MGEESEMTPQQDFIIRTIEVLIWVAAGFLATFRGPYQINQIKIRKDYWREQALKLEEKVAELEYEVYLLETELEEFKGEPEEINPEDLPF